MADPLGAVGATPSFLSAAPPRERTQILEGQQQGRENAVLLSSLPGAGRPFFPAADVLAQVSGVGPFPAPQSGPGAFSAAGARQRINVGLLEAMQAGRETSALLSAAMQPTPRVFTAPAPSPFLQPPAASATSASSAGPRPAPAGSPLAELTAGEEISAALAAAPPSMTSRRVATEAYQMEIDAQRQLQRQAAGATAGAAAGTAANRWEWFA